jgi:hypothetical protein
VAVSGVLQDPTTYSTTGTTLTFSAAPPSGTGNISVRFLGIPASGVTTTAYRTQTEFTATAGQTTFSVPSYTVGYIDVYRNGALLGSADFTATSGTTVVLNNAASAGDLVETVSFFVSSVINAIPAVAGAVTSSYLLDASVTQAKLAAGVAGNGPAFSAYASGSQALTGGTSTKIIFDVEEFDTNNNFASSRFTPTVAGYYQLNANVRPNNTNQEAQVSLTKNGSSYKNGSNVNVASGSQFGTVLSTLVYANGTTDYFEIFCYVGSSTAGTSSGMQSTYFNGAMVRAA